MIKDIILFLLILSVLGTIGYIVYDQFKPKSNTCPNGTEYSNTYNKCIEKCTSEQMYDVNFQNGKCRKICSFPAIWSPKVGDCITCTAGEYYDVKDGICKQGCKSDGDCGSVQGTKCINEKCCETPCNTADGYKCCGNCTEDPVNPGTNLCCSPNQICTDSNGKSKCCEGNRICINNKCLLPCGPGDERNISCNPNESCVVVGNIDSDSNIAAQSVTDPKVIYDNNTNTAYTCVNTKTGCFKGNQYAVPPSINNYYPCFSINKTDTESGLGFCSARDLVNDKNLIDSCKNNQNRNDCNTKTGCNWYDVLKEMKTETSQANLNDAIKKTFNQNAGYYCADDTNATYSRAIGKKLFSSNLVSTNTCDYLTCMNEMANPSISDIYYDNETGACVGLQQCNNNTNGLTNNTLTYDEYGNPITESNYSSDWTSYFPPSCGTPEADEQCKKYPGYICTNGQLIDPNTYCNNHGNAVSGKCVCNIAKKDEEQYYGSRCNLTKRGHCNNNGIPNDDAGTIRCTCDANSGMTGTFCNQVADIPQSLPAGVPDLVNSVADFLLLIPGPGVTMNIVGGSSYNDYSQSAGKGSQSVSEYTKRIGGLYIGVGSWLFAGINVQVRFNFTNNVKNSSTTITFNSGAAVTESPVVQMSGSPALNNYYYKQGAWWGDYCNVFYIGMNKI